MKPFHLWDEEIQLILDLRRLSHQEQAIFRGALHRTVLAHDDKRQSGPLPDKVVPIRSSR